MTKHVSVLALVLSAAPLPTLAHDFWFERSGDGFVLRYGHRGGELLQVDAAKVKSIRCVETGGAPRELRGSATTAAKELRVGGRCDVLSALHDGGYWSLTPDGEKNLPKTQVPDAVKSWASRQFAKWVNAREQQARQPIGDELEVLPVTDLSRVREGDKVTVRVLLQGKPISGAAVAVDHKIIGETDGAGEVRLKVRSSGVETITTSLRRPLASPEADAVVLEASLSFEVAK
jgi:nickel transport protein